MFVGVMTDFGFHLFAIGGKAEACPAIRRMRMSSPTSRVSSGARSVRAGGGFSL